MTKAELVNNIAIQTGYDKVTIMNIVESLMDNVKKSIAREENVYLRGFAFLCRASLSPYIYFRARKCLSSAVRNRGL